MKRTLLIFVLMVTLLSGCRASEIKVLDSQIEQLKDTNNASNTLVSDLKVEIEKVKNESQERLDEIQQLELKIQQMLDETPVMEIEVVELDIDTLRKMNIEEIVSYVHLHESTIESIDMMGHSSEGGEIEVFSYNDKRKYFIVTFYGEMGKSKSEYYLLDPESIFVRKSKWEYDEPFDIENSTMSYQYYLIEKDFVYSTDSNLLNFNIIDERDIIDEHFRYIEVINLKNE